MSVTEEQKRRFDAICSNIITGEKDRRQIGELAEKTVHAVLKDYYDPLKNHQEVRVGRYYADICSDDRIIEIQTANFDKLRGKLTAFLPDYEVTVVYPIPHTKWMIWVDEDTGELSKRRKSPLTGSPYTAFRELYKIKPFLNNPHLRVRLVLFDTEEYRLLNGWSRDRKRGSTRFDRLPTGLYDEIVLERPEDYLQFVPLELEMFTSAEFGKAAGLTGRSAGLVLHILHEVGVVERVGKRGNSFLYQCVEKKLPD